MLMIFSPLQIEKKTVTAQQSFDQTKLSLTNLYRNFISFENKEQLTVIDQDIKNNFTVTVKNQKGDIGIAPLSYLNFDQEKKNTYFTQTFDSIYKNELTVIPQLIQHIVPVIQDNINVEGIFRIEGDKSLVQSLEEEAQAPKLTKQSVHTCCSIFKDFYKTQMQKHWRQYVGDSIQKMVGVYKQKLPQEDQAQEYAKMISTIPNQLMFINFRMIIYLLNQVQQQRDKNKMNSRNLADIFSTWLFGSMETVYKLTLQQIIELSCDIEKYLNEEYPIDFNDKQVFNKDLTQLEWKKEYKQEFQKQRAKLIINTYNNSACFISANKGEEVILLNQLEEYYLAEYQGMQGYIYKQDVEII